MDMDGLQEHERRHLAQLRALAPECAVLLKRRGDFPLREPGDIALYGAGARRTLKGGTGSGDVNSRFYVTCEQGLEEAGFRVTTKTWLRAFDEGTADALPLEGAGDTALYVLTRTSGEGWDRSDVPGDYRLTETEIRDILAANEKYDHFLLVLNVCGPVDLTPVLEVDNILLLSQLGAVTGLALADLLLGNAVPSGKLASTWVRSEDSGVHGFGDPDVTRYREGVYVGYRYYDAAGVRPLFPFGFGLGYTDFALGAPRVTLTGGEIRVVVPVFNAGRFPGRETVQVYVSAPWGRLDKPLRELAGFAKSRLLSPGEAQRLEVRFALSHMASFDESSCSYILERGDYVLYAGTGGADLTPAAVVTLPETLTVRTVTGIGGGTDFADWRPERPAPAALPEGIARLTYTRENLGEVPVPAPAAPSKEAMSRAMRLDDDQLIAMCMGSFTDSSKRAGVIGDAAFTVAGAAGETSGRAPDIPRLVMADGPAGLRLAKYFLREGEAAVPVESPARMPEEQTAGERLRRLFRPDRRKSPGPVQDQFCTAVPIGTALAQSFDPDLVERVGRLVGEEMALFGVDLWLAPALNIHRSPLCGRNFEYYSEDPLISGLTAAAMTRGVQSVPGRGVTVKHFCCNSQETNRYISNSMVSQRALREIYVKGFEICLRLSDPAAVMTSYNLLNGVHTSEREDLSEGLLRGEWGFGGLIMTDWVIAGAAGKGRFRPAKAAPSIAAGNVFMPGSPADYRAARKALEDGVLPSRKARRAAAFLIGTVYRLRGK